MSGDGITWHKRGKSEDGRMAYTDAILSMFSEWGEFWAAVKEEAKPLLNNATLADDSTELVAFAIQNTLAPIMSYNRAMVSEGLARLRLRGVPSEVLNPNSIAQDWGQSQLNQKGELVLRLSMWPRREPALKVEIERSLRVGFPRNGNRFLIS